MSHLFVVDWGRIFIPSVPFPETFIRGTCTYLGLFFLLHLFRRQTGSLRAADLLVLVIIADAAQNAMATDYTSVTDGLLLVATIVFWEYLIDTLAYHLPVFGRWLDREPLPLIQEGVVQHANLERELMTVDDLLSQLRQHGLSDPREVRESYIEGDGHVSVIPYKDENQSNAPPETATP